MNDTQEVITLPAHAARLLAIEILLSDPESLANDALEGDLYILRDNLRTMQTSATVAFPDVALGRQ